MAPKDVKVIETSAYGYRFRSRTEARWAVAFTVEKIEWIYEMEGFQLPSGPYLPDFWLPQVNKWAEIKGSKFTNDEIIKCQELSNLTGFPCLMLNGLPSDLNYWATIPISPDLSAEELEEFKEHFQVVTIKGSNNKRSRIALMDYDLFNGHQYHLTEKRFYASCGPRYPEQQEMWSYESKGIRAARSARFEYGEVVCGSSPTEIRAMRARHQSSVQSLQVLLGNMNVVSLHARPS